MFRVLFPLIQRGRSVKEVTAMFASGDTVMHPTEGVCLVEDVRTLQFGAAPQPYYVLHPTGEKGSSTVYLPVIRGDSVLRRLLSREDILRLIHESGDYAGLWIEDSRLRKESFQRILEEGNYAKIIRMILELHQARLRRAQEGKKPCAADEALLAQAERLVHQEFSCVLGLTPAKTVEFIRRELQCS